MNEQDLSQYDVVGAFPSMEDAREGIDELGKAGIDADRVSLIGDTAEQAATTTDTRARDGRVASATGRRASAGAVIGAFAAVVIAAVVFALLGSAGRGVWVGIVAAAIAGALLGGFLRAVALTDQTDDWEVTYEPVGEGEVLVAVRADTPEDSERALDLLDKAGTPKTYRVGTM